MLRRGLFYQKTFVQLVVIFFLIPTSFTLIFTSTYSVSQIIEVQITLEEIGQIQTIAMARDVFIKENIAFVMDMGSMTSTYGGLLIYNISDLENPIELSHFYDGGRSHQIIVENDVAYVADNVGGLEIFNISELVNPVKIGGFDGTINDIYKQDNLVFLSDYWDGIIIVNVTTLTQPIEVTRFANTDHPQLRLILNDLAYVAVDSGLKIFDISSLMNITELVYYDLDHFIYDIQIVDDFAFMTCSRSASEPSEGLKIFNCTNPLNLTLIGGYYDGGMAIDLHVTDDYVIMSDFDDGLEVIDISNASNPVEVAQFCDGGTAMAITIVDDLIYVADGADGVEIIRITFETESSVQTTSKSENPSTLFTSTFENPSTLSTSWEIIPILCVVVIVGFLYRKNQVQ